MPPSHDPTQNTTDWIPIHDAAQLTGLSLRSLQRLIATRRIQAAQQPRAGRRPETVIHPADVAHLQEQRKPADFALTTSSPTDQPRHLKLDPIHALGAILLAREAREARQLRPLWLDIEAAAEYSGITAPTLRRMARSGAIPTIKDGRNLKFRRADLDKLEA